MLYIRVDIVVCWLLTSSIRNWHSDCKEFEFPTRHVNTEITIWKYVPKIRSIRSDPIVDPNGDQHFMENTEPILMKLAYEYSICIANIRHFFHLENLNITCDCPIIYEQFILFRSTQYVKILSDNRQHYSLNITGQLFETHIGAQIEHKTNTR